MIVGCFLDLLMPRILTPHYRELQRQWRTPPSPPSFDEWSAVKMWLLICRIGGQ